MFKKNKCNKCKKSIEDKYSFCPYCGSKIDDRNNDDWGMLGKDDNFMSSSDIMLPAGLNSIFNSLIKNLSKEMDSQLKNDLFKESKEPRKIKKDGISISISTFGNGPPKIKVTQLGNNQKIAEKEEKTKKFKSNLFTKEKTKEFSALPREEPKTDVRRFSDKIVYELEMPGVKSTEDVSVVKLENSIEIKAIGKKKAYTKIIPINLPIKDYTLSNGKLILELSVKN
ncbi:MAG: hypothetical protein M1416_00735 [Candidatus Pacearchaeota archaeon]|nr:hypothetical protein [Candidatus Pacearchaeota archaeon]